MKNWRKGLIVASFVGILALPVGIMGGGHVLEKSPSFCNSCHEMKASYEGWIQSGASKDHPDCISCHSGEGISGMLESKIRGLRMIGKHFLRLAPREGRIRAAMPEHFCLKCHAPDKVVDSHLPFRIQGETCADCHKHREGWNFVGQIEQ